MSDLEISDDVRTLIHRHLPTMDHIELLSVLRGARAGSLSLPQLAGKVRKPAELVELCLEMLVSSGLVAQLSDGTYRYCAPDDVDPVAAAVLTLYNERPVTLVKMLYERPANERPTTAATTFADAFRIRKKT